MARKRSLRIAIVLLTGIFLQEAHAVPRLAVSLARASICCARTCHHVRTPSGAARCCQVSRAQRDPATISQAKRFLPEAPLGVFPSERIFDQASSAAGGIAPIREVFARPAPIFLLDRSLRL